MNWQKSSYCESGACVEVGFKKSTHSASNGACVEVNRDGADEVLIRDSKNQDGPVLAVTRSEWIAFLKGIKDGEFDL